MSLYYGTTYGPLLYGGDVLYTRPESNPVAPEAKAEVEDPLERDRIAIGTAGYNHFCIDAPSPILSTYQAMREHPMIVFAYFLCVAPILAGTRSLVIRDAEGGDAPPRKTMPGLPGVQVQDSPEDKFKRASESVFRDHWPDILASLECLNFGHWTQEVIWGRVDNLIAPVRFNSFRPWEIVLVPDAYNDFAGFKLHGSAPDKDNERDARYAFHAICDEHRCPLIGHPRSRDALTAWWRSVKSHENADRIEKKASGIQMAIGIPRGQKYYDANGKVVPHEQVVQTIHNAAVSGKTWTYTLFAFDKETIEKQPELAKVKGLQADAFDWGDTSGSLLANIQRLTRLDKEIVRAYHRPEREAMEGQFGTKAEAGVHGQVGMTDSELIHADILTQFNEQTFNRFLVTNKGPDFAGRMYWKPEPSTDAQREAKQKVMELLIGNPVEGLDMTRHIDKRELLKGQEIPLLDPALVPELPPMPAGPQDSGGGSSSGGDGQAGGRMAGLAGANGNGSGNGN